ncbi:alpha-ketoglutarate-dependent dioxygenase AlkB [Sphingosinicella rhizophila]|uniref:Alpha-ketoglutarate-dependent dioxygenase AlkB n=1 Tax=Sphingosinicella rhizophila TaxID=3050082 RepID=A0ABU3Q6M1_9SPHN|nr:alpha-ketoglutarate-dependent dioxygenase AlkB [Sphingosinicella sp. GR2756]MDT9599040.1 alpha-ketoglutarate-dependent dioxygenase AlkB [Sphingosinicella sp. GR2756]
MASHQLNMFGAEPRPPEGLDYRAHFLSAAEEQDLVRTLRTLPFKPFEFQGFLGNRRTVSFGWNYRFDGSGLKKAEEMPSFLLALRDRAAAFAGLAPEALAHALLIEYQDGAGIGWHRDRPVFDKVVGISLLAPARLRFRRRREEKWERSALIAEPRSAYLIDGPARNEWEHSIPPMDGLRYSITFRNFRFGQEPS